MDFSNLHNRNKDGNGHLMLEKLCKHHTCIASPCFRTASPRQYTKATIHTPYSIANTPLFLAFFAFFPETPPSS
jgi:hypothetical protein